MFIKVQRPKKNAAGTVVGGSASIIDTVYDRNVESGHSRHIVVESLGRVIELSPDKKSGLFLSRTRGPVNYDVRTNTFEPAASDDPRLEHVTGIPTARTHVTFGDAYLVVSLLEKTDLLKVLQQVFPERKDFERLLLHVVHGFLQDGSSKKCSTFVEQSVLGFLVRDIAVSTLRSDSRFFELMGQDESKIAFFKAFVAVMRQTNPQFGKGCYIDSTPLPNDIRDNPYNRLRCQNGQGCSEQMRLALVVDDATGLPIWYTLLPGNTMDMNTIDAITRDVAATLGVKTVSYVLDSGYVSKQVVQHFGGSSNEELIARMPHRKGYPYKELYHRVKGLMYRPKYDFVRKGSVYFGKRYEVDLFGEKMQAYVMIDRERALRDYETYRQNHEADFEKHNDSRKLWDSVRFGFFILLSNIETTPEDLLTRYLSRVEIETVFKSSKSFEGLLPLNRWTALTVKGKILVDMIDTIIRSKFLALLPENTRSLMDLFYDASSLDCFREHDSWVTIEPPNKQAKAAFRQLGVTIPGGLRLDDWKAGIYP